jgi:hypothetical protein
MQAASGLARRGHAAPKSQHAPRRHARIEAASEHPANGISGDSGADSDHAASFPRRVLRPGQSADAPSERSEGARDAGGPADPRASMCRHTEAERRSRPRPPSGYCRNRKSAFSPASRARCLRFAPHVPRWSEFANHRCESRRHLAAWRGVTASPPKRLVTPTCGAGTVRLGPASRWVCILAPVRSPPLSGPAYRRPRSALGWTGLRALSGRRRGAGISSPRDLFAERELYFAG